jgi:hypothetical protein
MCNLLDERRNLRDTSNVEEMSKENKHELSDLPASRMADESTRLS